MRRIAILDAPSNLGLRPPTETSVPGVAKAPGALRDQGLLSKLQARDAGCLTPPRYDPGDWRPGDGVCHAPEIAVYSRRLADRIGAIIDQGEFPVILGGDCSIVLGSGLAMHRLGEAVGGRIGLVFVDGHSDFRHPGNASYVGAAAGEDLALVTGRGQTDLAAMEGRRPYFRDIDVVVVGIRPTDEYRLDLQAAGIVTRPVPTLRVEGAARSAQWAKEQLVDCAGFWVHLDLDVLDPAVLPAVDAPEPGGIAFPELEILLAGLVDTPHCLGVEITVFDPDYDPDGSYAEEITAALVAGLTPARQAAARPDLVAARQALAAPLQPPGRLKPTALLSPTFPDAASVLPGAITSNSDAALHADATPHPDSDPRADSAPHADIAPHQGPAPHSGAALHPDSAADPDSAPFLLPAPDAGAAPDSDADFEPDAALGRGPSARSHLVSLLNASGRPEVDSSPEIAFLSDAATRADASALRSSADTATDSGPALGEMSDLDEGAAAVGEARPVTEAALAGKQVETSAPAEDAGPMPKVESVGDTEAADVDQTASAESIDVAGQLEGADPVTEADRVAEAEPVAEAERATEAEPVAEAERAAEAGPTAESGPVGGGGPVAGAGTVAGAEPVVEAEPAGGADRVDGGALLAGAGPVGIAEPIEAGDPAVDVSAGDSDEDAASVVDGVAEVGEPDEDADPVAESEPAGEVAEVNLAEDVASGESARPVTEADSVAGDESGRAAEAESVAGEQGIEEAETVTGREVPDLRPLGQAPLLDSAPLPATRPGMLRPRAAEGFSLPVQRPAFDVGPEEPVEPVEI